MRKWTPQRNYNSFHLSLSLTHTHTHTHSLSLTLPLTLPLSLSLSLSFSLSLTTLPFHALSLSPHTPSLAVSLFPPLNISHAGLAGWRVKRKRRWLNMAAVPQIEFYCNDSHKWRAMKATMQSRLCRTLWHCFYFVCVDVCCICYHNFLQPQPTKPIPWHNVYLIQAFPVQPFVPHFNDLRLLLL